MQYMTKKNIDKAVNMIMEKGYDKDVAVNMALSCFAMVGQFGGTVEDYIRELSERE